MSAACEPTASRPSRSQTFPAAAQTAVQLSPVASARRHSRSAGSIGGGDSGGAEGGGGGGGGADDVAARLLMAVTRTRTRT